MKRLLLIVVIILLIQPANHSQWHQINSGISDLLLSVQFVNEQVGWTNGVQNGIYNLYKTTNGGFDWNQQYSHSDPFSTLFQTENIGWLKIHHTWGDEIFKTSDGGDNWVLSFAGIPWVLEMVYDMEFISLNTGWCVGWVEFGYLFIETSDGGVTWIEKTVSPNYWGELRSIEVIDNMNLIISGDYILFKSTDGGNNWVEIPLPTISYDLQFFDMNLGWKKSYNVTGGLLHKTFDGGYTWNQQAQPMRSYQFITQQFGWYINNNEIYYSTNGGNSWTLQNSNTNNSLYDIFLLDNNNGWAVGENGTILHTANGGIPVELISFTALVLQNENAVKLNWSTATGINNSGFEIQRKMSEARSQESEWEKIGFVPGFGTTTEPKSYSFTDEDVSTGIYKYLLKQIDFDGSFEYSNEIEVEVDFTPKEFVLYQNYPNPFNPSTKIKYTIPKVETHIDASIQMVTLKVYDVLGNEVATLVNEEKQPGIYEVEFDASNLSSGIYFYQLKSGSFSQIKKMVLLR